MNVERDRRSRGFRPEHRLSLLGLVVSIALFVLSAFVSASVRVFVMVPAVAVGAFCIGIMGFGIAAGTFPVLLLRWNATNGVHVARLEVTPPDEPERRAVSRERRSPARRVIDLAVDGCWVLGIYIAVQQDSSKISPQRVLLGVAAFMVPAVDNAIRAIIERRFVFVISVVLPLLLAFGVVSDRRHIERYPSLFTVIALIIGAVLVLGVVPFGAILWRSQADERERAIANASMAFALLATVVVAFAFDAMRSVGVGPTFRPGWVLYTAGVGWLASSLILRRRM